MKRWKLALLIVLALVVLAAAALLIWQRVNLKAAYSALTQEPEKLAEKLETVRNDFQQSIQEKTEVEVIIKPPTLAQSEAILEGSLSAEEIKEALGITELLQKPDREPETEPEQPVLSDSPQDTPAPPPVQPEPEPEPQGPTAQELINQCVAELTACQVDLMEVLGGMKQAALDEWIALRPEERTPTKKKEIGLAGLSECYKLEGVIDDQVRQILARYTEKLSAIGTDLSVIDTLWDYYEEEKAAQKAYYMNKYLD